MMKFFYSVLIVCFGMGGLQNLGAMEAKLSMASNSTPRISPQMMICLNDAIWAVNHSAEILVSNAREASHRYRGLGRVIRFAKKSTAESFKAARQDLAKLPKWLRTLIIEREEKLWEAHLNKYFESVEAYVKACENFHRAIQKMLNEAYQEAKTRRL